MNLIARLIRVICRANQALGYLFSWFSLAIVVVCFVVVVQRYVFSISYIWMQDLFVWLNGAMFMGIAGYTLMQGHHVRVDVFYRPAGVRHKAWVDLFGSLVFILPFSWIIMRYGLPFVQRSWQLLEGSSNYAGMPGLYIMKTFIIIFAVVIAIQAIAMILRSILVLRHRQDLIPDYYQYTSRG